MPTRLQYMGALRLWLIDNGISTIRFGWLDPSRESLGNCELPLACILPHGGNLENLDVGPATVETEDVAIVIWGHPSDSTFDESFGGFADLWALRDKLLAAPTGLASLRDTPPGANPNAPYLSTQVDFSVARWEDYWFALDSVGYPGGEFTLKIRNRIGPVAL